MPLVCLKNIRNLGHIFHNINNRFGILFIHSNHSVYVQRTIHSLYYDNFSFPFTINIILLIIQLIIQYACIVLTNFPID